MRRKKTLFTKNKSGSNPFLVPYNSDINEYEGICNIIKGLEAKN